MTPELREIPGFDGYLAGNDGFIYSVRTNRWHPHRPVSEARRLRNQVNTSGRYIVQLSPRSTILVSRLACLAWHGEPPPGTECSHLNGNGLDNRPSNLCWESHVANADRKYDHGTNKLPRDGAAVVYSLRKEGWPLREIAAEFGVNWKYVSALVCKERRRVIHAQGGAN